ncbi:chain-length determining protein [Duganella sp. Leaf126]|uniref:chain length determinant protein EpsF n=1 Tax=Duganella sp. Leaf126 TaxID=1736266 RepID=UPI0006F996D1|nr:chain length determinant protein EpsF [Duganella sp. Leaf126]KQQ46351.1 chain-length determining protein [Duganella sp. Leaf126]
MNFTQLFLALRARYKIIIAVLLVTVIAALGISLVMSKVYRASTSLVLNTKGVDPITGMTLPVQMMSGYVATQADIIRSKSVALKAVESLKLAENPAVQQQFRDSNNEGDIKDWLANLLLAKIEIEPSRDSSVLTINFKGEDPTFVAAVANAFAQGYLDFSVQLKTDPAMQASGFINTQIKLLREQYELAQSRLSKYQKENNIYSADNRVDVETARLNELSSQLVQVQGLLMEAQSRSRQATGNAGESPDVLNNSLIQNLKSQLATAEARLADTSQRLAPNHPQYIAAKSEVDKLRSNLQEQIRTASSGVASNSNIYKQRESELRAALAAQKARVLELNGARDEFAVLTNEADNARRSYENAMQRYNQTNLEGQARQSDIAILSLAVPPTKPSSPRLLLNLALAVVVGLILGGGAVLVMELLDQRVRSASHMADVFGLPVLGAIAKPRVSKRSGKSNPPAALLPQQ